MAVPTRVIEITIPRKPLFHEGRLWSCNHDRVAEISRIFPPWKTVMRLRKGIALCIATLVLIQEIIAMVTLILFPNLPVIF